MIKGYITVFFSISITLCLSLLVGLVYGVRENAMRMRVREAFDVTMTSAFAEYNVPLWQQYGLVFVDAGYGYEASSIILTEEHAKSCMQKNFDESSELWLNEKSLLKLQCANVETEGVRFATDDGGRAVINQAVRYMKYKYKIEYIVGLYKCATEYEEQSYSMDELKKTRDEALENIDETDNLVLVELKKSAQEAITDDKSVGLLSTLRLVLPSVSKLSGVEVAKDSMVSGRDLNKGNAGKTEDKISLTDSLFFKEYLMNKCGNYLAQKEKTIFKYELEYIIAGKNSDVANLESVVNRILLTREAANLASLYADEEKQSAVSSVSAFIAALIGVPEAEEPIRALINTVWAYIESVSDVKKLLKGKRVPFIKEGEDWENGFELIGIKGNDDEGDEGLCYADYLRIFLYLQGTETQAKRFMDICELDIRNITSNSFRLDYCFDYWAATAYVFSDYGYDYSISGKKDMEE